jgi:uncharacterized protein (TIGR00303 family)
MARDPILFATAEDNGRQFVARWRARRARFCCVLAHTDTCLLPGISAAGASPELRPLTPAADAEAVWLGRPRCLPEVPSNPLGPPGPAPITRAAVVYGGLDTVFVAAGLRVWPRSPHLAISSTPGRRIDHGRAVPDARSLYQHGIGLGRELVAAGALLVLGESVPGGTTTALALLEALGIAAIGRVSGSMAGNGHRRKTEVARAALRAANLAPGDGRADPLGAVAELGDPMQPLAAGMVIGASAAGGEVLLAGGSQMVAVAALIAALEPDALRRVAIGTTRWVVTDPAADVAGLARDVEPGLPLLAANLSFRGSRHAGLRRYEDNLVKEGVGAGGACIAALLATERPIEALEAAIDDAYDVAMGRSHQATGSGVASRSA